MLDRIETVTIPAPMILGRGPRRFVIQANQAITGERRANTVQPMMKVRLYTPRVRAAVA